ncbi:MAG: YggT family protein [Aquificaceae bacterium]|nr:YggT family protein [Aquificaceae bacterium]MCS7278114.1 YggT family protein [Aquificaceae bacterium]MDW8066384.1 YggT family protein [Aquificaceae bacterium]MDW8424236.1 YggT family protein [Aquificaceae bacterium]
MIEQVINYTLAFYMWLVLGRAALSFFTTDRKNFFYNMLYLPTEPAYRLYRSFLPCCHTMAIVLTLLIIRFAVIKIL